MTAANAVQNMALAHEISVNQDFKLEKLDYNASRYLSRSVVLRTVSLKAVSVYVGSICSIEKQIHETVHKAFWNSLREDFEKDPVEYKHAFIILGEAKQVRPHSSECTSWLIY